MYISIRYQDENKIASECRIFNCRVRREATWEEAREFGFFDRNSSLSRLGVVHHTDKNQYFHNYLDKYDFVLSKISNESFTMIELGVFKGESMRMWHEYFPSATIVGVDIDKDAKQYENRNENMIVEVMDISKPENLNKLKQSYVPRFILDDASHIWSHQILALSTLYPCLPSGGIYIIEDLETSVMNGCMKKYGDINVRYKLYVSYNILYLHPALLLYLICFFKEHPECGVTGLIGSELPLDGNPAKGKRVFGRYECECDLESDTGYPAENPLFQQMVHHVSEEFLMILADGSVWIADHQAKTWTQKA